MGPSQSVAWWWPMPLVSSPLATGCGSKFRRWFIAAIIVITSRRDQGKIVLDTTLSFMRKMEKKIRVFSAMFFSKHLFSIPGKLWLGGRGCQSGFRACLASLSAQFVGLNDLLEDEKWFTCFSHRMKCTSGINCRVANKNHTAFSVTTLIFAIKDHKLKFSCRKFIIFQVQRIFSELRNYLFARRDGFLGASEEK